MVAIPVRMYKAARRERMRFHRVYRPAEKIQSPAPALEEPEDAGEPEPAAAPAASGAETVARVRNRPVSEANDEPVEPRQVLSGYEIEKGRYVTFEPEELAALRPKTSTEFDIGEFVRLDEIDPVFFETSYYAAPDAGGEKPYALLFEALSETGYAALGKFAMHGREHAAVVRPGRRGLIVHTLFYFNEVRADEEYRSGPGLVTAKELDLARTLVLALAAPFDAAKLKDTLEERLRTLVRSRADTAVASYRETAEPRHAPVVDIMEALRKSLELARKPPGSEKAATGEPRRRRRPRG